MPVPARTGPHSGGRVRAVDPGNAPQHRQIDGGQALSSPPSIGVCLALPSPASPLFAPELTWRSPSLRGHESRVSLLGRGTGWPGRTDPHLSCFTVNLSFTQAESPVGSQTPLHWAISETTEVDPPSETGTEVFRGRHGACHLSHSDRGVGGGLAGAQLRQPATT